MVLIAANVAGNAVLIAMLQPICNAFPHVMLAATNCKILYECQDFLEERFAPGRPSQHAFYKKRLEDLRDRDVPEGMSEVSRLFTTNLTYYQMAGGVVPEKIVEDLLDGTLTHSSWRQWVQDMHMETLRETPAADREHTWQLVLRDIRLRVEGDATKDPFRAQASKRTATQAGFSSSEDTKRVWQDRDSSARGRGSGRSAVRGGVQPGRGNRNFNQKKKSEEKHVVFDINADTSHYGPSGAGQSGLDRDHCNRCWATDHWAADCKSDRCFKCGAPIKGATYHNATICSPNHQPGSRSRRDAATGRRGGRGPRGGRGN